MGDIILAGSTSGSITVAPPAVAGSGTLTLPTGTDTLVGLAATQTLTNKTLLTGTVAAAAMPAGSVLQVVTAVKTDTFSTASTSFTAITGISVSITPRSTSSRIAVFVDFGGASMDDADYASAFRVMRDSTAINVGDAAGSRIRASFRHTATSGNTCEAISFSCIDSPSSVSSITYTVQVVAQSPRTFYLNRTGLDSDGTSPYQSRAASTITVMEIQG